MALTPVITSGGIDLSVGSLMGLSAVVFGKLWRDGGLPIGAAAALALGLGRARRQRERLARSRAGRIPPLIVTLGSFSLLPGPGRRNDRRRRQLHQFPGELSVPGPGLSARRHTRAGADLRRGGRGVLGAAAPDDDRPRPGRDRLFAEGARYAGLPVERLVALVYMLSGLVASLAAIIYVAHLGQAKADAGTGYELAAITAVVLGGTSIFGGRGSIPGTLLGLLAIAVLQNGLRLADLPAELAGVLTGTLLLVAIGLDRHSAGARVHASNITRRA